MRICPSSLALVPLALLLAGCPVWLEDGSPSPSDPPACAEDGDCGPGERCDPNGTCEVAPPCADDFDCPEGEWCGSDGACFIAPTSACRQDLDCGGAFVCVQDFCRDAAEVCQFNYQCGLASGGAARACVDNGCGSICSSDEDCASSGTRCATGYCVPDRNQCAGDEDCSGDATCFLGRCLTACSDEGTCALADDACSADGLCRPRWAPTPVCETADDCQAGSSCVDGVCRVPCPEPPLSCLSIDVQFTQCNADTGYCETEAERTAECFAGTDCGEAQSCANALCRTL